jgi:hypothetical protein
MWLVARPVMAAVMVLIGRRFDVLWNQAFRGLSLVMVATTVGLLVAVWRRLDAIRNGDIDSAVCFPRLGAQLVVSLFALLLLAKMFFNVLLLHYGFALAMPAVLVMAAVVTPWWPNFIEQRGGSGIVLRAAGVAAVGFVIYVHLHFFGLLYADKREWVAAGADAFLADPRMHSLDGRDFEPDRRGRAVNLALQSLAELAPGATLATVPEGTMINYLTRRINPTPYINLMPPEVAMFGQERIRAAFEANPPDYILLVLGSNPADYGHKSFAADYGRVIFDWIRENYQEVPTSQEPSYPLVLMKRR